MYKLFLLSLLFILTVNLNKNAQRSVQSTGTEILGRPTDSSITLNITAGASIRTYIKYGTDTGVYSNTNETVSRVADDPIAGDTFREDYYAWEGFPLSTD